jgi:hypothetical protein
MIELTETNLGKYVDFTNEYEDGVSGIITEIKYEQYIITYINDFDEECEEIVHPRDISYIHE